MNESKSIGGNLKKLRAVKDITLQDLSNTTGLSVSFLSLVENGKSGISLANLQKILKCFDTTIHDLIDTPAAPCAATPQDVSIVRSEEANRIHSDTDDVKIQSLVTDTANRKIWPGLFIMEPGATMGPFNHDGEEFSYIIQGKIEVSLENTRSNEVQKHILTEGDTIYYPSSYAHTYVNLSKQKSIFLAAVTPPSF